MKSDEISSNTDDRRMELAHRLGLYHPVQNPLGLLSLAGVVTRRFKWIVAAVIVCLLLAIIITAMTKPVYESTSTIELNKSGDRSLGIGISEIAQIGSDQDSLLTDQQTETAILQGDSLALAVIQKLGLASQPPFASKEIVTSEKGLSLQEAPATRTRLLDIFRGGLSVNPIRGTRLIEVSYASHDPKQASLIANALVDAYKSQYLESHYQATAETSDWLTKQLSDLKANVEASERKLTDFERESGIFSFSVMPSSNGTDSSGEGQIRSPTIQKLDALNVELTQAEANRIEKEAIYRLVQSNNGDVILGLENNALATQSNSMVLTQGGGLSNLQQLRQQQNELKISLAEAANTYGANNRHLKEMQVQMQALDGQIQQELRQILARAGADYQLAKRTEDALQSQFDQQQEAVSKLNEKAVQFAVLSQEAYSRKKLYEDLYTKLQEANISQGLKATNISIVDPARPQSVPVRPRGAFNLAMGMLFGLFVGVSAAYAVDSLDRTVTSPIEVEEVTGIPVIGVIPTFGETESNNGRPKTSITRRLSTQAGLSSNSVPEKPLVWILDHPDSGIAEAFRALRTSIMLSRAAGGPRIVLITGCTPGEGKTTIATNLAVAFAQHDKKVIVVEADMRRPRLKHRIDFPASSGLSNVLAGTCTPEEAILRGVYVKNLDVLPAGPRPPMPSEILGSSSFDELLKTLRSSYDLVLIDSPPALAVTDAVSISRKAEGVVWVTQAGVVTRPYLTRAVHLIERSGMDVIGFVVNRISRKTSGYGYGYDYEVYDSNYAEEI